MSSKLREKTDKLRKPGGSQKKGCNNPLSLRDEYSMVIVKWQDACYQYGECTSDLLDGYLELVSVGHLVKATDKAITIGMDYAPHDQTWRHVTHIPVQMILEIVEMNEVKTDG